MIRSLLVCLFAAAAWAVGPAFALTPVNSTTLTTNTRWGSGAIPPESEYVLQPSSGTTLTVNAGVTLTIDPGTTIRLAPGISLVINGTLSANGTAPLPIQFTANGAAGDWGGLQFGSAATAQVRNCTFSGFGTYPVSAYLAAAGPLFAQNSFVPRGDDRYNAIRLFGGTLATSDTLSRPPSRFCYLVDAGDDIRIEGSGAPVLTIESGTVVKFSGDSYLLTGETAAGALRARNVVFTSAHDDTVGDTNGNGVATLPGSGDWRGFYIYANTIDAQCLLDTCVVRYAGGGGNNGGIRVLNADPTITHGVLEKNLQFGLRVEPGTTSAAGIHHNLLRDNTSFEIAAPPVAMANLVPNNTVLASGDGRRDSYEIRGATLTTSITLAKPPTGFCYHLTPGEQVRMEAAGSPVLTIADGTVVKLGSGSYFLTGETAAGALRAKGVVFTSTADDTVNDTNGDGTATSPAPGNWQGLYFYANTIDAQTLLDSCVVRYAGGNGNNGGIRVLNADPTITRCVIEKNVQFGLRVEPGTTSAVGIHHNLLRDNTSFEIAAPPVAMANLVPNNTVPASGDGRYDSYEIRGTTMTASATLAKPPAGFCYHLTPGEQVRMEAAGSPVLTIADGTVVKLGSGSYFLTGETAAGALRAKGVVFTSTADDTVNDTNGDGSATAPATGNWQGLYFYANTIDAQTLLDSCVVRYAGGNGNNGGIRVLNADPTITRCVIEKNVQFGLRVEPGTTSAVGIHHNLLRDNTSFEIVGPPQALANLVPSNDVRPSVDGRYDSYEVRGVTLTSSVTLPRPPAGFCYHLTPGEQVRMEAAGSPVLTIADGTVVKLGSGSYFLTGETAAGALRAKGVVFTSTADDTVNDTNGDGTATSPAPGNWQGLYFYANTIDAQARLDSCIVRYAGGNGNGNGLHLLNADPTVVRCLIEKHSGYGIQVDAGTTTASGIVGNVIRANTGYEVRAPLAPAVAIVNNNAVAPDPGLEFNAIEVIASTVTNSIALPHLPGFTCWYFNGNTTIAAGATLTIPAGTVVKMGASDMLTIAGTLVANGSVSPPYEPIVFTSIADDFWWGDTDGDGATSPGAPGNWARIEINTASNTSQLHGVLFRYGGAGSLGQLRLLNTGSQAAPNVLVEDCFFEVDLATGGGVHLTNANPRLTRCGFRGASTNLGVQNLTAGLDVDATGNWWGHETGPNDASPAALAVLEEGPFACVTDVNAGSGVKVTDCVRYRPFLAQPLLAPVTGTDEPAPAVTESGIRALRPNPARSAMQFVVACTAGSSSALDVIDVSGRKVRSFAWEAAPRGELRTIAWDLRNASGESVRPGLYFVRFRQSGATQVRTVVVAP